MANAVGLPMSFQSRARFENLLNQAPPLGIDPVKIAAAGPVALRALLALTQAKESESIAQRELFLEKAQDALSVLQHRKHPELVQQIQKAVLALHGRGNDSEMAHVTRGEIVVPLQLQTAEVLTALRRAAEPYGVPIDMLRVGAAVNRINPETGAPEFGVIDWISGMFANNGDRIPPASATEAEPKIVFSPPFENPAVAAEEANAVKDHLRKFPFESRPILSGVNRLIEPISKWLNAGELPPPPSKKGGFKG